MALTRWSPARELLSIRYDMNRLFNGFFGRTEGQEGTWWAGARTPPVDMHETDEALILKAGLPGFAKDDVSAELKDNTLTLKGQRRHEMEVKEEHYHRRERTYGSFQRAFLLPATVDPEKVTASYKDGCWSCGCPRVRRLSRSASPSATSRPAGSPRPPPGTAWARTGGDTHRSQALHSERWAESLVI